MGGDITVVSTPGVGSEFLFTMNVKKVLDKRNLVSNSSENEDEAPNLNELGAINDDQNFEYNESQDDLLLEDLDGLPS